MPELEIFDYQLSTIGFECLTLAFMTAYGLAIAWMLAFRRDKVQSPADNLTTINPVRASI
jgi:hypothetical protein